MRLGVLLAGFLGVVLSVEMMAVRDMRVVPGLLVLSAAMALGGLAVMLGGRFVVLGGFLVMLGQQAGVHGIDPSVTRVELPALAVCHARMTRERAPR